MALSERRKTDRSKSNTSRIRDQKCDTDASVQWCVLNELGARRASPWQHEVTLKKANRSCGVTQKQLPTERDARTNEKPLCAGMSRLEMWQVHTHTSRLLNTQTSASRITLWQAYPRSKPMGTDFVARHSFSLFVIVSKDSRILQNTIRTPVVFVRPSFQTCLHN
jgi:hypothetical protein